MSPIEYPAARAEVRGALEALADVGYQRQVWLDPQAFDSLTHAINVLFDDSQVLPDPSKRARTVGAVVYEHEVASLARLGVRLGEMLDRLGQQPDHAYLDDARWPDVVETASAALAVMTTSDGQRTQDR